MTEARVSFDDLDGIKRWMFRCIIKVNPLYYRQYDGFFLMRKSGGSYAYNCLWRG